MFPNKEEYTDLIIIIKLFHTEKKSDFYIIFLEKLTILHNHFRQNGNIIINSPLIPMLLSTFRTRKKNSDFTIFHFITRRIHCSLAFACSISRNWTIYVFWSKTKRAVITAGFLCFGNFFPTIEARKRFINSFHKNSANRDKTQLHTKDFISSGVKKPKAWHSSLGMKLKFRIFTL